MDFKKVKSFNSKNSKSDNSNITVLTDKILETTTDSTLTYTLAIKEVTDSKSTFENLVLSKKNDEDFVFKIYKFSYNSTNDAFPFDISTQDVTEDQINFGSFNIDKFGKILTVMGADGCTYTLRDQTHCMDYRTAGVDCFTEWVIEDVVCYETSDPEEGPNKTDRNDSPFGNNNGNTGDSNDPSCDTCTNNNGGFSSGADSPAAIVFNANAATTIFLSLLSNEETECLNNDTAFKNDVTNFLLQNYSNQFNDFTAGTRDFATNAVNAHCSGGKVDFDDKIINKLTGKAKCIYDKLEQTNGNLFKKTISKFINDVNYNLIFQIGNCTQTDDACTNADNIGSTGEIVVTIEDINQSGLGIAALILHESIHAEIHRFVSRYESGVDRNNRPRLFQLYAHYKGWAENTQDDNYNWVQVAHHNYMVENYVTQLANAVRELDNFNYPLSHYIAYGWDGLTKYGYTSKRLTSAENTINQNLRAIANQNSQVCK